MDKVIFNGESIHRPSPEAFSGRLSRLDVELLLAIPEEGIAMSVLTNPNAWDGGVAEGRNGKALKNRVLTLRKRGLIEEGERISIGEGKGSSSLQLHRSEFGTIALEAELQILKIYEGGDDLAA